MNVSALTGERPNTRTFLLLSSLCILLALAGGWLKLRPTLLVVWAVLLFSTLARTTGVKDLLILYLLVAPFISNRFAYKLGPIPDMTFDRLFAALALVPELADRRREGGVPWFAQALDRRILLLIIAGVVSILFCFMVKMPARLLMDCLIIPFIMYSMAKRCSRDEWFLKAVCRAFIVVVLICAVIGMAERFVHRDLLIVGTGDPKFEGGRINGPAADAEEFGMEMTMMLLVITNVGRLAADSRGWARMRIASLCLGILAVFNTLTRGIWIAMAIGFLAQLALNIRRAAGVVIAMVILLPFALPASSILFSGKGSLSERLDNTETIYARIATYASALKMFADKPITGVGFGAYTEEYERGRDRYETTFNNVVSVREPHNAYLVTLVETGVSGLILFLVVMGSAFSYAAQVRRFDPDPLHAAFANAATCVLLAYLVDGLGHDFTRNVAYIDKLLFMIIGITAGALQPLQERARALSPAITGA